MEAVKWAWARRIGEGKVTEGDEVHRVSEPMRRLVLVYFAWRADVGMARAYPKVSTVVRDTGLSRRQVLRTLESLAEDGHVGKVRTPHGLVVYLALGAEPDNL